MLRAHWERLAPDLSVWRLPRIVGGRFAVWRERGRYCVMREIGRTGTYEPSGPWHRTMRAVRRELAAFGVWTEKGNQEC